MNHHRFFALVALLCSLLLQDRLAAQPTFYVSPSPYPVVDATGDNAWQAAVDNNFIELDLDGFFNGEDVDMIATGEGTIDVGVGGLGGDASTAEIFFGAFGGAAGGSFGTVSGGALLNRDAAGDAHSQVTFDFSPPVRGFGAWLFDNNLSFADSIRMIVTEVGGDVTISGTLESGNGTPHFVEGFLGATSTKGIESVAFEIVDETSGEPVLRFIEVDHLQIASGPCDTPYSVEVRNAATSGTLGFASLNSLPPRVGLDFSMQITDALPFTCGCLAVSLNEVPTFVAQFDTTVYPDLATSIVLVFETDDVGDSPPLFSLSPAVVELCGVTIVAQGALLDAGATGGVQITDALVLKFGN